MNRQTRIAGAIAAALDDGAPSVVDAVCGAAVALTDVTGAGLSLMADGHLRGTAGSSDAGIGTVQDLQFALGEGPSLEAWRTGTVVAEPDLAAPRLPRWAAFSQGATAAGIAAVFAFPLQLGAIRLGVLAMYRDRPGTLSDEDLAVGIALGDVATQVLLSLQAGLDAGRLHDVLEDEPPFWAEVHQATGMIAAQLDIPLDDAFARLRARAFADGRPLRLVAADVVARRMRMDDAS